MAKNQTPGRLIVFSSSKSLTLAGAIQANLADQFDCTVWQQGALPLNIPILDSLHAKIDDYDFAICLLSPDVKISSQADEFHEPSPNVIYEAAVASAKLGIDRTFVFVPNNIEKFYLPDYIKIRNLVPYRFSTDGNLRSNLGPPCFAVRESALALGIRKSSTVESFGQKIEYAGAVCFRIVNNELQFLTVESTAGRRIIPKGKVNQDEKITDAALRYAHDEGAIIGTAFSSDVFGFRHARLNPPDEHLIAVKIVQCDYEVSALAPFRNRQWHSFPEFKSAITQGRSFQYIREARDLLDSVYSAILEGLSPVDQVAAIPYRIVEGTREILLVTSLRSKRWILPKGNIEPSEAPDKAAIREAFEEAGVRGRIEAVLGRYEYSRRSRKYTVQTFLLEVGNLELVWEDRRKRERRWFSAVEAANRVDEEQLKQILLDLARTDGRS